MRELHLTTMLPPEGLDLAAFTEHSDVRIHHTRHEWGSGWNRILSIGLNGRGADVSEIGSTWLENLVDMASLRPFTPARLNLLGGPQAFPPAVWLRGEQLPGSGEVTAAGAVVNAGAHTPAGVVHSIPWTLDTRMIAYRRDALEQAGVREEGAFATPEALHETLARLHGAGEAAGANPGGAFPYPLAMATAGHLTPVLASFVWGRDGYFRSPDFRRILLAEPPALHGLRDYYALHRFIHPEAQAINLDAANARYYQGRAAVLVSGNWCIREMQEGGAALPHVRAATGFALVPGVPFVGSTHLVIWQHSRAERDALRLLAHLVSAPVLGLIYQLTGSLPARLDALETLPIAGSEGYRVAGEALRRGRSFRSSHLWAGIEGRLNELAARLWLDLFANPSMDLEAELKRRVTAFAARLEKTVLLNW